MQYFVNHLYCIFYGNLVYYPYRIGTAKARGRLLGAASATSGAMAPKGLVSTMDQRQTKPQAAREIEARARARRLRIRVAVVERAESYTTASRSRPGVRYAMRRTPAGWACSCDGYYHTGACKHLGQVERRSEREGWEFGAVAPLHRVGRYLPLTLPARGPRGGATVPAPDHAVVPFRPAPPPPPQPASHQHHDERHAA